MKYGALGAIMGHELSHAFDRTGMQYDAAGDLSDVWNSEDRRRVEETQDCLVEEYGKFGHYDLKVDGTATINENIADNGGLDSAFKVTRFFRHPTVTFVIWAGSLGLTLYYCYHCELNMTYIGKLWSRVCHIVNESMLGYEFGHCLTVTVWSSFKVISLLTFITYLYYIPLLTFITYLYYIPLVLTFITYLYY